MKKPKKPAAPRSTLFIALGIIIALPVLAFALAQMSSEDTGSVDPAGNTAPAELQVECTPGGSASVRFTWTPAQGAQSQRLQVGGSPQALAPAGEAMSGSTRSRSVEGIQAGQRFFWQVTADTPSGPVSTDVRSLVPCGPAFVSFTAQDCNGPMATLGFEWAPGVDERGAAASYRLELSASYRFAAGVTWSEPLRPNTSSFQWRDAVANVEYHYRVLTEREGRFEAGEAGVIHVQCDYLNDLPCNEILAPVNKQNRLGSDCIPAGIITLPAAISVGEQLLTAESAEALQRMFAAAASAGYELFTTSTYRSYDVQNITFSNWVQQLGVEQAERVSARPGHSEHQLGTTADVTAASVGFELVEQFARTAEGRWLAENAARFGFVISYAENLEYLTGYDFEPWHLRYVGEEAALAVEAAGITLHEYLLLNWY